MGAADHPPPSAPPGAVETLIRRVVARPWLSLSLLALATALVGGWGSGIPIKSDMEALFPDDTPNVVRARAAREVLGSRNQLQIVIGSPSREVNRAIGADIAARLAEHEDIIGSVEFERDIEFFEKNALLYLPVEDLEALDERVAESIRAVIRKDMALDDDFDLDDDDDDDDGADADEASTLPTEDELRARYGSQDLRRYFESPDGTVIAVKAYPSFKPADTARAADLMARTRASVAAATEAATARGARDVETTIIGDYTQLSAAVDQIRRDVTWSGSVAFALIALILTLYFRRLRGVILVLVPLAIGIAWTVGFARASIGQLNMITALIFTILVGLGIDFAVHAASRADEAYDEGRDLADALPFALSRLGRAMLAAAITTMATFLALTVFEFRGFSQFGWIAAGGVALCLLAVYLVLPALSVALDRIWPRRPHAGSRGAVSAAPAARDASAGPSRRAAWSVVIIATLATSVAVVGLPRLAFDGDMRKMKTQVNKPGSSLGKKYFVEAEPRTSSPALVITADLAETEAVYRWTKRFADRTPYLNDVVSLYTFVPERQAEKLAILAEMKRRIDNKYGLLEGQPKADADALLTYLQPQAFGVDELPPWVLEKFTDSGGRLGRYVLLYPTGVKSRAEEVLRIQAAVGQLEIDGKTHYSTAAWMITGDAFATVQREGPLAVGLAALVVLLLLIVDLRRARDVLIAFVPLVVGFVVFLGVLAWAEIPLNLFNIVVLPTIFGIGVDTSIHLMHRLRDGDSVGVTLRTTGVAAGISAVTTAVGFASLLVVANEGLRTIGWVAVIGIASTYICTTALIAAFETLRTTASA